MDSNLSNEAGSPPPSSPICFSSAMRSESPKAGPTRTNTMEEDDADTPKRRSPSPICWNSRFSSRPEWTRHS